MNILDGVRLSFGNGNRFTASQFLAEAQRRLTRVDALIARFDDADFVERVRRLIRRLANGGGPRFPVIPFYGAGLYGGFGGFMY